MKSVVVKYLSTGIFVFFFIISGYPESDKCSRISADTISKHIPIRNFNIISSREVHGFCEIIINVNERIIPLYGNEECLISGDLFYNKQNITKDKLYEVNKKSFLDNKKALEEVVAIEYKPAAIKSEKVLYMFTEPLCPYCHKAGSEVKMLADKYGITVKILLISMKGEEGKRKCVEAACRHFIMKDNFNLEQYNQLEWKKEKAGEEYICEKGIQLIQRTEDITKKINLEGVPFFYMDNGDYISGADMEALELLLKPGKDSE